MDQHLVDVAIECRDAAHADRLNFPEIVGRLMTAGFESYAVDYRLAKSAYYLPDGQGTILDLPDTAGEVAPRFDAAMIRAAIREAQDLAPGYSYRGFCETMKAAGCAGYIVSFPGRRVVYFGRSAENHVEHFPE